MSRGKLLNEIKDTLWTTHASRNKFQDKNNKRQNDRELGGIVLVYQGWFHSCYKNVQIAVL